jgi:hypothetical protein
VEMFGASRGITRSSTSSLTWGHSIVGALQTVALMWIDGGPQPGHSDDRTIDDLAEDITHLLWPGMVAILGFDPSSTDV